MTGNDEQQRWTPEQERVAEERLRTRRNFLKWLIRAAYGTFAVAFALPALAIKALTQAREAVGAGDVLVYATAVAGSVESGQPVNVNDLAEGQAVQVFPQGKADNPNNLIELVRLAAGNAPNAPLGIVAYSAICTHLGCSVLPELTDDELIPCPCHASLFDPSNDAAVVGGPANRPLPSLPVTVNPDGTIVAAGEFEGPIGPA